MTVSPGTRLGPYEVVAPAGAGGMGEVFRGRDTRLDRTVAIKVLPSHLSTNRELRERFDREARTISSLSHPHICTLFDVGHEDGVDYLVMEYLEGESLADRLSRGPLPLADVLRYGAQIAQALDRAHRAGVVHRDLKPGNVMITKSGAKLLDFGLAKIAEPVIAGDETTIVADAKPLTAKGTILGTFQYMAPEQLEGDAADARTDIFAFGAVLYEMLTGRRAFDGKTRTSLIAAIVDRDPAPISELQPLTPPALEHVIRKCLAKDREERWQSAHDVAEELKWIAESGSGAGVAAPPIARKRRTIERLAWLIALLLAIGGIAAMWLRARSASDKAPEYQLPIASPPGTTLNRISAPALSPDGKSLAISARSGDGVRRLWVLSLTTGNATQLDGTDYATNPFWSPDGNAIGFFAGTSLKRVDAAGGPVEEIGSINGPAGGASWGPAGILYSATLNAIIYLIPPTGGQPTVVVDESSSSYFCAWPQWLPDGRHFLYFSGARSATTDDSVRACDVKTKTTQRLFDSSSSVRYVAPGFVLYRRGEALAARAFDAAKLRVSGPEVRLLDSVAYDPSSSGVMFDADASSIVAVPSGPTADAQLLWMDRSGKVLGAAAEPGRYYTPRISHDGTRIATDMSDPVHDAGDIWIIDSVRGTTARLTFDRANESAPVWSNDDSSVFYFRSRGTMAQDIFEKATAGTGQEQQVVGASGAVTSVSPDGRYLLTELLGGSKVVDVLLYDRTTKTTTPWIATPFFEADACFSPDGKWVVYTSRESGRYEVYVQNFPTPTGRWMVSRNSGLMPMWSRDGREIFFVGADGMLMTSAVSTAHGFEADAPQPLFRVHLRDIPPLRQYDVTKDGRKILVNSFLDETPTPLTLLTNWQKRVK